MKFSKLVIIFVLIVTSIVNAQKKNPNILFIMSDDHTTQAIGAYGGHLAKLNPTPTIDKIAKEGIVMNNAFCHNAICTPSRASIITGQYSSINGIITLKGGIDLDKMYLPNAIKAAGYNTAVIGKWHIETKPETFDYYRVLPGQGDYFDPIFYEKGHTDSIVKKRQTFKGAIQIKGHSSDAIGSSAIEWFDNRKEKEKPFFLKLHFKAPHGKWEYAPRYKDYLEDVTIPEPENYRDRKNFGSIATRGIDGSLDKIMGSSVSRRNEIRNITNKHPMWDIPKEWDDEKATTEAYQAYLKAYLRCVKGVDDNVKKVLDYLIENGELDNTIIMYTGDQGFYLGEHDFFDKRWGYEEGMRMPFIVRYPKTIKAGSTSDAIVENVDFASTMIEFAGGVIPEEVQGKSFKNVLEDEGKEQPDSKDAAYYHYQLHMRHHYVPAHIAIRTKEYKLMLFYGAMANKDIADSPPAWELYDMVNDPKENNNLYDDPKYAEVIVKLKKRLKELRHEYKVDGKEGKYFAHNKIIEDYWEYDEEDKQNANKVHDEVLVKYKNKTWGALGKHATGLPPKKTRQTRIKNKKEQKI